MSTGATLAPGVICPANYAGVVVGVCAFSGSLCGSKLVPSKCVLSSCPPAGNASRWALRTVRFLSFVRSLSSFANPQADKIITRFLFDTLDRTWCFMV